MRRGLLIVLVAVAVVFGAVPTASASSSKRISIVENDGLVIEYPADTAFFFRHGWGCDGPARPCDEFSRDVADVFFYEVTTGPWAPGLFFRRLKSKNGTWLFSDETIAERLFGDQKWFTGFPAGEERTFAVLLWQDFGTPADGGPWFVTRTVTIRFVSGATQRPSAGLLAPRPL